MQQKLSLNLSIILILNFYLLSISVNADQPNGSAYLDGGSNKSALILAHGRAKYPTWKVVEPLRKAAHDKLGYHTLSLQMPSENKKWKKYAEDFELAYELIKEGIRFLQEQKSVTRIYLMGHSMGSRMASAFISENPENKINGLIIVGCRNNGGYPLACEINLKNISIPVLDIWGAGNEKDSNAASEREQLLSKSYSQAEIAGANHKLDGYDEEFVNLVINWLQLQTK